MNLPACLTPSNDRDLDVAPLVPVPRDPQAAQDCLLNGENKCRGAVDAGGELSLRQEVAALLISPRDLRKKHHVLPSPGTSTTVCLRGTDGFQAVMGDVSQDACNRSLEQGAPLSAAEPGFWALHGAVLSNAED